MKSDCSRFAWLWMFLCFIGCGSSGSGVSLVQVDGIVTLDGDPLNEAEVVFRPENGRISVARTDRNGHYQLTYVGNEKGALAARHRVSISTFVEQDRDSTNPLIQDGRPERVPKIYNVKTTLEEDLTGAKSKIINFDLKSPQTAKKSK